MFSFKNYFLSFSIKNTNIFKELDISKEVDPEKQDHVVQRRKTTPSKGTSQKKKQSCLSNILILVHLTFLKNTNIFKAPVLSKLFQRSGFSKEAA